MSYVVTAGRWPIRLNEQNEDNSVLQNVAMILASPRGSIPMYRDFGLSMESLDRPVQIAEMMLVSQVKEAVELYEPKAEVLNVTFEVDPEDSGHLIPTVEIEIV